MFKLLIISAILNKCRSYFQQDCFDNKLDISNFIESLKDSTECTVCTVLANKAKEYLDSDKTAEELYADLLKVCSLFSQELNDQCTAFIGEYGKPVIELLIKITDPQEICTKLKFC